MDIKRLHLHYMVTSSGEQRIANILIGDWDKTLQIFDNKYQGSFSVKVLFAAIEDNSASLFESFEPLKTLASFLTTTESDVTVNVQNVNKDFDWIPREHSNEQLFMRSGYHQSQRYSITRTISLHTTDAFDVDTEEGKRIFQCKVLSKMSRKAESSRATQEKLPNDLANADRQET